MDETTVNRIKAEADMGLKAVQAGRPDLAGQHFNNALNHAEDLEDDRTRRDEISVLSMLFDECGFPDLALMAAEESVEIDRRLGLNALLHEDLLNVGTAHLNLDNDAKAEACFREALDLAIKQGDWANAASANTNLGNVATKHGEMKRAIAIYEKSLEYLAKETSDNTDNTEINTRVMLLQASEIDNYDVDRSIDNARKLCGRFWKDMQDMHRQAAKELINQAVERYLESHPQKNAGAWKAETFPMIFG
jgi:tetratricopeptide (TPR) repeat protein